MDAEKEGIELNIDIETWKLINRFTKYYVSNFGRVKSLKMSKERILCLIKTRDGYLKTYLCTNGKTNEIK